MTAQVVLVGAPGAGKSSVGAELAARHRLPHWDTDELVETASGTSVADIFVQQGEAAFRAWEHRVVLDALRRDGIVSTGGGAVMDPEVRAALEGLVVVWLTVGVGAAARRIGFDSARPLLRVQPRAAWRSLMAEREPLYAQVASHRVATDELDVAGVVDAVERAVGWA